MIPNTWDIETRPRADRHVFLVGITWRGEDSAPKYHTTPDALWKYLSDCGGKWHAHNGGNYDVLLFARQLRAAGAKLVLQGSRVLSARTKTLDLRDSIKILPDSLESVGKTVGLPKIERTEAEYQNAKDDDETRAYARRDLETLRLGLQLALERMREFEPDREELPATLSAWGIERVRAAGWEPLADTSAEMLAAYGLTACLGPSERWRPALYGGRVEVLRREAASAYVADIRSSYTRSVFDGVPGRYLGRVRGGRRRGLLIAHVRAHVPASCEIPPLPFRAENGRLYFPTGTFEGWFCEPELELVEACGGRVDFLAAHAFERSDAPAEFAREAWRRREASTGFERFFWKSALNWCWGKPGEHPEHESLIFAPSPPRGGSPVPDCPDAWYVTRPSPPRFPHVAGAAWITSHARARLCRALWASSDPCYCDTDCVADPLPPPVAYGAGCGEWELENDGQPFEGCEFLAPKLYRVGAKVRAKGFGGAGGFARRLGPEHFSALSRGEPVEVHRLAKMRTLLRSGAAGMPVVVQQKRAHLRSHKRVFLPDGHSRPLSVNEIAYM